MGFKCQVWVCTFCLVMLLFLQETRAGIHSSNASRLNGRKKVSGCNLFRGRWVVDASYPLYDSSGCPFIDDEFNCQKHGRRDNQYLKYSWQPDSCKIPRFNGADLLRRWRGKKIMFVGDSLSLNMWESLSCMIHAAVPKAKTTFSRRDSLSSVTFDSYGVTLYMYRTPYLVDIVRENVGKVLNLNSIEAGNAWKGMDILIFNSWHWWVHTGRSQGYFFPPFACPASTCAVVISSFYVCVCVCFHIYLELWLYCCNDWLCKCRWDYIRDGSALYKNMDRLTAFSKGLTTWSRWVDQNIDPSKTRVFFQGISPTHYQGKDWNQPQKSCSGEAVPLSGSTYPAGAPPAAAVVNKVLSSMKKPVYLLDITTLSQLRKDAHPSTYSHGSGTDCSHWCLPGLPDTWNQLLYAALIM
ncbi:protein trichome birefringence-like 38 isoform X1 [Populus alba x Populus x berolinensis]|nr:protein trichome birefringence-like 38 isoform X1 [Populus alba x Populus x berolinensis]